MLKIKQKENNENIESRIKVVTENISKTSAEEAVALAMKELDTKLGGSGTGSSRISQIIRNAKSEKSEKVKEKSNGIICPTCKDDGHEHALKFMENSNNKLQCTGEECGKEYSLISSDSDYYCASCKTPHKKPATKEEQENDECPFCSNNVFIKADTGEMNYKKVREKVQKQKLNKGGILNRISLWRSGGGGK